MKCKGPWKSRIMVYKHPEATACSMSITLSNISMNPLFLCSKHKWLNN